MELFLRQIAACNVELTSATGFETDPLRLPCRAISKETSRPTSTESGPMLLRIYSTNLDELHILHKLIHLTKITKNIS